MPHIIPVGIFATARCRLQRSTVSLQRRIVGLQRRIIRCNAAQAHCNGPLLHCNVLQTLATLAWSNRIGERFNVLRVAVNDLWPFANVMIRLAMRLLANNNQQRAVADCDAPLLCGNAPE